MSNSREEILSVVNTTSIMVRELWEVVFNEKIDNSKWNEMNLYVAKRMRHKRDTKNN